jgi:hypothetical protein
MFNVYTSVDHVCIRVLPVCIGIDVCPRAVDTFVTADTRKSPGWNVLLGLNVVVLGLDVAIGLDVCNLEGNRSVRDDIVC